MKKIKVSKATRGIVVATAMGIFSLFSAFTATIAWFSSNLTTQVSGMEVRVHVVETSFAQMTVHRCDLSNSTSTVLHFYETPSVVINGYGATTVSAGIEMDNYSELSQTQPVLLLFTLNENTYEDDITISATSDNQNFVSVITADNIDSFPFSSVVKFKAASYSGNSFPFTNVAVSDLTTTTSFVTIGNATATYNYSIEPFHGTNHTVVKYIAIVMDYYPEAIEYVKNSSTGYTILAEDNDNAIDFFCYWTLEI